MIQSMMPLRSRQDWRAAISDIPVFDTHTHLNKPGEHMAAQNVWDIVEYFWFKQELMSVGYPKGSASLPESDRIARFVDAWGKVRNTVWAKMVQETFISLYGLELSDANSIRQADEAVRAKGACPDWPHQVVKRLNIKRITVNSESSTDFPGLPGVGAALPIWPGYTPWIERILESDAPRAVGEDARADIRQYVAGIAGRGCRGMRVHVHAFERGSREANLAAVLNGDKLPARKAGDMDAHAFIAHAILSALSEHKGMFAQFFLGITPLDGCREPMGIGTPHTVPGLYPLFSRYACDFELVAGAPRLNMDIVQVARLYPNVHAGGLWWYNFRSSTYREAMQARIEAVPAGKSVILASDARCIEWCYAKTLLVKYLLADFLHEQVQNDWINENDALWVVREWLHDAAERRYV